MKNLIILLFFLSCSNSEKKINKEVPAGLASKCSIEEDSRRYLRTIISLKEVNKTIELWRKEGFTGIVLESNYGLNSEEIDQLGFKECPDNRNDLILKLKKVSCEKGEFILTTAAEGSFFIGGLFSVSENEWDATVLKNVEL